MNEVRSRAGLLFLILLAGIITLSITSCEDPGSVGGSFVGSESDVVIDTMEVSGISTDSLVTFSGNLPFFSAGQFNDPQFGEVTATGLIKPSLPASGSNSIGTDAEMKLKLIINKGGINGDTRALAEYDLVEIDQIWRGNAWKLNDPVPVSDGPVVASFTVEGEDSLEVPLSSEWINKYRGFFESDDANRDSLYQSEFFGLAIVPKNEGKIIPFEPSNSEFIVINPEEDTFSVSTRQSAYSLERTHSAAAPAGSKKAISTFENVINFDLGITREELGTVNVSRVELVVYQNNEVLNQTLRQASNSAVRPENTSAQLHLINPENISESLFPGNPISVAEYKEEDGAFHFDITSFASSALLDGIDPGLTFYVTLQSNNGVIRSSLLYTGEAPPEKRPKLIVTSIKSEGSSN